jgi:putative ABC transport system permease protein
VGGETGPCGGARAPLPASLLEVVRRVPGVRHAEGTVTGYAQLVDERGRAISPQGPPTLGVSFGEHEELTPLRIVAGRRPAGPDEVAIDAGTAERHGFGVGDRVRILFRGPARTFRVVGIARFGSAGNLAGATLAAFDTPTAQEVLGRPGRFDSIAVSADPGISAAELRDRIARALPSGIEAVTGDTLAREGARSIRRGLGFVTTFLLVFAYVALFVAAFIVFNTMSITVAQRSRELALLRAVGATRGQVARSVLAEGVASGLVASVAGMAGGVGLARLLVAVLASGGADIPAHGTVFAPRTALVALVTGVAVSALATLVPAWRAGRVPPVAALRDVVPSGDHPLRRRVVGGLGLLGAGSALVLAALFADLRNGLAVVGLGMAGVFVGTTLLSPLAVVPLGRLLGAPFGHLLGAAGKLAHRNALRDPRRTAATASALMVGLGLVSAVAVTASSARASVETVIRRNLGADFLVSARGFSGFSPEVARRLQRLPEVGVASGIRFGTFRVDGAVRTVEGVEPPALGTVVHVEMVAGSVTALARGALLVDRTVARDRGWQVGERVDAVFARTGHRSLVIGGIYEPNQLLGQFVLSTAVFEANFSEPLDLIVGVTVAPGTDPSAARRAIERAVSDFPNVEVRDQSEYARSLKDRVDQVLALAYGLLGLAIVIALIGIVNTMSLSVMERTREIGLVRAVGMSRRQVRRMIRWEAVVVAVLGAALGLAIGVAFGATLVRALRDQGIERLAVPVGSLLVFVVLSAIAGMVAAALPARRAARLDILAAVTTE